MKMTEIGYFLGECWNVWDDFVDGKCSQVRRNRPCCGRFRDCKGFRPFAGHHSAPPSLPDMPKRTTFLMVCFCCCVVSCVSEFCGNYGEGAYSPSIPDISSSVPYRTSLVISWNAFIMPFRWRLHCDGCRRSATYAFLGILGMLPILGFYRHVDDYFYLLPVIEKGIGLERVIYSHYMTISIM